MVWAILLRIADQLILSHNISYAIIQKQRFLDFITYFRKHILIELQLYKIQTIFLSWTTKAKLFEIASILFFDKEQVY